MTTKVFHPEPQFHGVMIDVHRLYPTLVNVTSGQPGDENKPMMIYDLDSTLTDDSKRKHYVEGGNKDFPRYLSEIHNDEPIWPVIEHMIAHHAGGATIAIITGRDDSAIAATLRQLHTFGIAKCVSSLLMRPHGNYVPAAEFKEQAIGLLAQDGAVFMGIVDDDETVRKMATELGIEAHDPADIIRAAGGTVPTGSSKIILPGGGLILPGA